MEKKLTVAYYYCEVDGGAVGTKTLRGSSVPEGVLVTDAILYIDVIPLVVPQMAVPFHYATISLSLEKYGDLLHDCPISEYPWGCHGSNRIDFKSSSVPIQMRDERNVVATIKGEDLASGAFRIILEYIEW